MEGAVQLALEQDPQLGWDPVVGDEQALVVGERYQVTIEEPVSAGERKAIMDNVRAALANPPDVGGLHF